MSDSPNLKTLIHSLSKRVQSALEAAASDAHERTNFYVELEHVVKCLLADQSSEAAGMLRRSGVEVDIAVTQLGRAIGKLASGNAKPPALSREVIRLLREGYIIGSLERRSVSSGILLTALADNDELRRSIGMACPALTDISADGVRVHLGSVGREEEAEQGSNGSQAADASDEAPTVEAGNVLSKYCVDLTQLAGAGKIAPVVGRDREMREIEGILLQKSQNNPILLGDPGVGKTAVVEGFAARIAHGEAHEDFQNVRVLAVDLGALQAGAGVRGELEARWKAVIDAVRLSSQPVVLFIDEIHLLISSEGEGGAGEAANLLKPALARGELRTIGATTWVEYKKRFERDPALVRRFQPVRIQEPDDSLACEMIRTAAQWLEKHHRVTVLQSAVEAAVKLSRRYIPERQLPDKARSLVDAACATVGMSQRGTPGSVQDARRVVQLIESRLSLLRRESQAGVDHSELINQLEVELNLAKGLQEKCESKWRQEAEIVRQILAVQSKSADTGESTTVDEIVKLRSKLKEVAEENPLVFECVDAQAVAATVSTWTGIPAARMAASEIQALLDLRGKLEQRIVGQGAAIEAISRGLRDVRAGLRDPRQPLVFLLVGSSGVGKTETALTVADVLYSGQASMTVINMSEYKEEHKVGTLLGSPKGYVGSDEGGLLTEAVRRRPYSVVLLDEMEKAHRSMQDVFYNLLDTGSLRDGVGRDVDFRNTTIFITTNSASEEILELCADPDKTPDQATLLERIWPSLEKDYKPAFLGRCEVIVYYPLSRQALETVVRMQLDRISRRTVGVYGAPLSYDDEVVNAVAGRCMVTQTGARNVVRVLNTTVLPELASQLLPKMAASERVRSITIRARANGFVCEIA